MRIWITTAGAPLTVEIRNHKPDRWSYMYETYDPEDSNVITVCRKVVAPMVRKSGKRLPRNGSEDIVTGQLTFK